ncbi:MAG: hypothetical protein OHK0044_33220 [Burkholderiaceae bacterium]
MNGRVNDSDAHLGAFIDGELDAAERERALASFAADAALARRACELRQVKDLVRHAYADAQPPVARRRQRPQRAMAARAAAACLLVAAGAVLGWGLNDLSRNRSNETAGGRAAATTGNVVVHVSSGDIGAMQAALDRAESLATAPGGSRPRIEVLANSAGIDLLVQGASPFAQRIARMQREHPNVVFLACGQTLDNLRRRHVTVVLLPDVQVVSSAIDQVLRRLHEGWRYAKA